MVQSVETANRQIIIGNSIMFVMYFMLLAAAIHNTYRIVLRNQRYKGFHMSVFYILVYINTVLRVTWLALMLKVVLDYHNNTIDSQAQ